jgi:phage terminase large subunit
VASITDFEKLPADEKKRILHVACPDLWVEEVLGERPWNKQQEILRALSTHGRVAVASCNGAGKSWLAARAAAWFVTNFVPSQVVTTAPTDRQVRRILWKEIHRSVSAADANGHKLGGKLLTKSWEFTEDHFAMGFATRDYDADSFQGLHGDHLMVIVDEAAGISESVWEGIMSVLRGRHAVLLAIGNPTTLEGTYYKAFSSRGWWTTHISAFDTPNLQGDGIVVPGLVTAQDIDNAREDWGEGSFLWQSRILGQFPTKLENTLISLAWVESAGQENPPREGAVEVAADVARYGNDSTVFVARQGANCFDGHEHSQMSTMETAGKLIDYATQLEAKRIRIDAVGLGAGTYDRVAEHFSRDDTVDVVEMNAGSRATDDVHYADAGTEWWSNLAKKLQVGEIGGDVFQQPRVMRELSSRPYKYESNGKMRLMSKEHMRKAGIPSPDWADAVAMVSADIVSREPVFMI